MLNKIYPPLILFAIFAAAWGLWSALGLPSRHEIIPLVEGYYDSYGLAAVFVSAALESMFFVGVYFPGSTVIFLSVILASGDPAKLAWNVASVTAGFLIGGSFNYALGKYGWYRLLSKYGLTDELTKAKDKVATYRNRAIFGGYMYPGLASLVSTSAGMLGIGYRNFIWRAAIAAFAWNALWSVLVAFAGRSALNFVGFRASLVLIGAWILFLVARHFLAGRRGVVKDASAAPEILLVYKPKGITSFDVIRRLRRKHAGRKMGHAGTLDPLAEGLMILGIGAGTKRLSEYIKLDKTYVADVELGRRTATGDLEGAVLEESPVPETLGEADVREALSGMMGVLELPVPAYSAVKRGGRPLYELARKGREVDAPVRAMRVDSMTLVEFRRDGARAYAKVAMGVGSGVYVRSVAEELGRRLGVPATVAGLVRTRIGEYTVDKAEKLDIEPFS